MFVELDEEHIMKIFPKEITNLTCEKHYFRFSQRSVIIYIIIITLIIITIVILPLVQIDISIQSQGIIRSKNDINKLFSPITGQIKKVAIYENIQVKKGDTLIWLKTDKLIEDRSILTRKVNELHNFISDIKNMLNYRYSALVSPRYISDHSHYRQRLREFDLEIAQVQREYKRAKTLFEKTVIPEADFEQKEFALQQKSEEKDLYVKQKRSEWNDALYQFSIEKASLDAEIKQAYLQEKFYLIVASAEGSINDFSGISPEDFVLANQQIANIVPTENLIVESYVSTNDIGYLCKGMKARFQIDAYNYNEWGLATGKIIDISNQPIQAEGSYFFKVKCSLDQKCLMLKSGYRGQLKNGLTLTSRFTVTQRSLFQLLYDKTDNWMNPKMLVNNYN